MRYHGMVNFVAGRTKMPNHARNRVGHAMGEMHSGIAEAHSSIGGRQEHFRTSLIVERVLDCPNQILRHPPECLESPNVADGIGTLVSGAQNGALRAGTLIEGDSGVGFQRMAEYIQSCRGGDLRGLAAGILRINYTERRFESPMSNTGLGMHSCQVKDSHSCGLTSSPGRSWDCDQWFECSGHWQAFSNGRVHVIQEVGRVGRIEVCSLGSVHGGTAANSDKAFEFSG